jgi:Protein of unknown function (DUF3768)
MSDVPVLTQSDRVRVLNDNFRTTFLGGRVVMTAGVAELELHVKARVLIEVQTFSNFNADNDPHREHDFGAFEIAGEQFFWKIDCYDRDMEFGSPDPSDPEQTVRVLTIMFASEY